MERYCVACNLPTPGQFLCPRCGGPTTSGAAPAPEASPRVPFGFWARMAVGLLLAQGLYFGLRQAVTAITSGGFWDGPSGLAIVQALQAIGLVIGGAVAGAGQSRGLIAGTLLGLWNAALLLTIPGGVPGQVTAASLVAVPAMQAFVGALGGVLGGVIWPPLPRMPEPPGASVPTVPTLADPPAAPAYGRPDFPEMPARVAKPRGLRIEWHRLLGGLVLAVGGTLFADLLTAGVGFGQHRFLAWELSALSLFVGGTIAGSNSRNGAPVGLILGVISAVMLVGALASNRTMSNVQVYLLELFGRTQSEAPPALALFLLVLHAVCLGLLGGWFGALLLPPLGAPRRRLDGSMI